MTTPLHRRAFLGKTSQGLGAVALASLMRPAFGAPVKGVLGNLPLPQKAKRVIWLTMAGGPSHLETFDPKPLPSIVRAKVPCTSSQARTQREQTMHLAGSKSK